MLIVIGIVSVLFCLATGATVLTARQNYKLKLENNNLRVSLLDMMSESLPEEEIRHLLSGDNNQHSWQQFSENPYVFTIKNGDKREDILRCLECTKCCLIKKIWVKGWANAHYNGSPMDGLFRTGTRLNESDERLVPCNVTTSKFKLLLTGNT
jgi:hypothetical protein